MTAAGRDAWSGAIARFPEWMQRVLEHLGVDPEDVLEPMRRLEGALRASLAE